MNYQDSLYEIIKFYRNKPSAFIKQYLGFGYTNRPSFNMKIKLTQGITHAILYPKSNIVFVLRNDSRRSLAIENLKELINEIPELNNEFLEIKNNVAFFKSESTISFLVADNVVK